MVFWKKKKKERDKHSSCSEYDSSIVKNYALKCIRFMLEELKLAYMTFRSVCFRQHWDFVQMLLKCDYVIVPKSTGISAEVCEPRQSEQS